MCVKKLFLRSVLWRSIIVVYIAKCVHLVVKSVTNHLQFDKILSVIKSCTLRSDHITAICVICHSITWRLWKDICSGILMTIRIPVICVVKVSVVRVVSQDTTVYMLESVLTSVMCVISPLPRGVIWKLINMSILESVLTSVLCVANHFVIRVLLILIRPFILTSVHLLVVLVTDHSDAGKILTDTFSCTLWIVCSAVVCMNEQECLAKSLKLNWCKEI